MLISVKKKLTKRRKVRQKTLEKDKCSEFEPMQICGEKIINSKDKFCTEVQRQYQNKFDLKG